MKRMAQIVGGGQPVNDAERKVIAHLRDHAPADWLLLHNVEVPRGGDVFEVDLLVLTPHSLVLVDVKGTRGRIEVFGTRWYPAHNPAYGSPATKLRGTARALKGLLTARHRDLERVYVDSLVVLTAPDARLIDHDGRDRGNVTDLTALIAVLGDVTRVRRGCSPDVTPYRTHILQALNAAVRSSTATPRFGHWEVEEELGGDAKVTEYRAVNATLPGSQTVLLRVYRADPMADSATRAAELRRIANAYQSLAGLPAHPNVVRPRDFFAIDDESRFVLVLDDVRGEALHLRRQVGLRVLRDLLAGLAHAHAHGIVHRALTPASVLVTDAGQALLTGFDYAKPGPRSYTLAHELGHVLDTQYVAPEARERPDLMTFAADVYSAGVIAQRFLAEPPPVVLRMLGDAPAGRPTAAEALGALSGGESRPSGWFHRLLRRSR